MTTRRKEAMLLVLMFLFAGGILAAEERTVQAAAEQATILLPVAMYHSVTEEGDSPTQYVISPSMLEQDLQYLQKHSYQTVTVKDVVNYVKNGTKLPEKAVMLTFDDGYYNNYKYVYPLMEKYHMRAVISPVGILTERFSNTSEPVEHETWSYCTGAELQEMAQSGVIELQNHSYDFHELKPRKGCLRTSTESTSAYRECFVNDTKQAQDIFAALGIEKPICYTYPYGACNQETAQLVKECGFAASLSCEEGIACLTRDTACLWGIRRNNRDGRLTSDAFWEKLLAQTEGGA